MVTAVWMIAGGFIVLVGFIFLGATFHHDWSVWADRKRAEHVGDLPPEDSGTDSSAEGEEHPSLCP